MPEAPQIHLLAKKLQSFVGKEIISATALTNDLNLKSLEGQKINLITVFGKQLLLVLPTVTVRVHLLMFGRVKINERNEGGKLRLGLKFKDDELNFYACDVRLLDQPLTKVFDFTTDVMAKEWDAGKALSKIATQETELISDVLIDQDIFNGLGNKGVNESLYRTKVHPASVVGSLSIPKRKEIIKEAVEFSFDYMDWEEKGIAKDKFSVYKKKLCPVHGTQLKHEVVGDSGRKCHFCNECQILYK